MRDETESEKDIREAVEYSASAIYKICKYSKIPIELIPIVENEIMNAYLTGLKNKK